MIPLHEEEQIKYNEKKYAYVIMNSQDCSSPYPHLKISQKMTCMISEVDVASGEELGSYDEEYTAINDLTIATKDYIRAMAIGSFKDEWERFAAQGQREGNLSEMAQTFQLPFKSMQLAV